MPDLPGSRETSIRIRPDIRDAMRLLRKTPERLDLEVRKRFRELAGQVRDEARANARGSRPHASKVASLTTARRPRVTGRQHWDQLVNTITSGSQSDRPTVQIGSERVPWALGFEFGSLGGPHKAQFPAWRGNGLDAGYFFYPAVRRAQERMGTMVIAAVEQAFKEAFPD